MIDAENHWAPATGDGNDMASYTPRGDCVDGTRGGGAGVGGACPGAANTDPNRVVDENKKLRAVATYSDRLGTGRKARVVSEFPVRAEVSSDLDGLENPANGSPGFDPNLDYTRTVLESLGRGMNVGAPVVATDPNNDTLTYELMALDDDDDPTNTNNHADAADAGHFSLDMATGQVKVKSTLDWDMNGTPPDGKYRFMVVAIDPSGETAEQEVTVVAEDANDAPVIMGSRSLTLGQNDPTPASPSEVRVMEQDSDDRDGNGSPDATYYGTSDGNVSPEGGTGMGLPVALVLGNQNVFTVSDEDERGQRTWTLRGDDADEFVLTQGGTTSTGTQGALTGPNEPIALVFVNPPDFEMPTDANGDSVYKVTLVATDTPGAEDTRDITIFVDNIAEQGDASLSLEQPYIGTEISASVQDPDGGVGIITWQWSKTHGNVADDNFTIIHGATESTYTPVKADNGAYLRVTATYIDATSDMDDPQTGSLDERVQEGTDADPDAKDATMGDGVQDTDGQPEADADKVFRVQATSAFAVRVEPGDPTEVQAPEFAESDYERTVAENAEVGTLVGEPIPGPSDSATSDYTYDLDATATSDNDFFTIDEYGQIRVGEVAFPSPIPPGIIGPDATASPTETAPEMEDPTLDFETDNSFVLTVRATDTADANRTDTTRVTVLLRNLNERPYFDEDSRKAVEDPIEYAESRKNRVALLAATEPDGKGLRWEVTGADAPDFRIVDAQDIASDGKDRVELHFMDQPNFESPTDAAGDTDGNGEISGADEGAGDNFYHVTVRATEDSAVGGGPNVAVELHVTVEVTNSNEPGTVELNWLQPEVGTGISASLTDPDGGVNGESWTWYRAKVSNPNPDPGTDTTDLTDQWVLIIPANAAAYTPVEDDEGEFLLARVEYTDTHGAEKAAVGLSAYKVQADVEDDDNNSPDFNQDTTTRTILESAAVGDLVGPNNPVDVDENEDGDRLTYQLDNDRDVTTGLEAADGDHVVGNAETGVVGDVGYFSINKATGQLSVAKKLDFDNNPPQPADADGKYVFWVRATDPSGEGNGEDHDYIKVTVTATDVNDAPRVIDGLAEISINEVGSSKKDSDITKFVGLGYEIEDGATVQSLIDTNPNLYHRSDEDRVDAGSWPEPIAGPDGRLFEYIVPDDGIGRRLVFKKANLPDYENPMDANRDNVYEVTIVLQDNDGAQGTRNIRITVMNVDEAGKLVLAPEQPDDGMPVIATLDDPDGVLYITDWKWAETGSRATVFPTGGDDNDGVDDFLVLGETTDSYTGKVGNFVWAMVDYRDGASVVDDPVTALDERNDDLSEDSNEVEQHKYEITEDEEGNPVTDTLFHNSDLMIATGTDNAVQKDPDADDDIQLPSTEPILVTRMVYENVPSTGYVGIPLEMTGEMGLRYKDANDVTKERNTIGGPDGASFVFAENYDEADHNYYDMVLTDSDNIAADDSADPVIVANEDPNDKRGQLAAAVVTHFDAEATKNSYIIEITDPDAEVAVGPVRVTITVVNVNEAPSAPSVKRGDTTTTPTNNAPEFAATIDTREVAENTAPGTDIGTPVTATDDDNDDLTYTLGGADMASFGINSGTGQITTSAALDYETTTSYSVTVTASDGNGGTASVAVTITVTDEGLADSYDANEDGMIDETEVLNAVEDYFNDVSGIGQERVLDIVELYFSS